MSSRFVKLDNETEIFISMLENRRNKEPWHSAEYSRWQQYINKTKEPGATIQSIRAKIKEDCIAIKALREQKAQEGSTKGATKPRHSPEEFTITETIVTNPDGTRTIVSHAKPTSTVSQKRVKKVVASSGDGNRPTSSSSKGSGNLVEPPQTTENETLTTRRRPSLVADKTATGISSDTSSNKTGTSSQTPNTRAVVAPASKPKSRPPVPVAGNTSSSAQQL